MDEEWKTGGTNLVGHGQCGARVLGRQVGVHGLSDVTDSRQRDAIQKVTGTLIIRLGMR